MLVGQNTPHKHKHQDKWLKFIITTIKIKRLQKIYLVINVHSEIQLALISQTKYRRETIILQQAEIYT